MSSIFNQAEQSVLVPAALSMPDLEKTLSIIGENHIDYGDIYLQSSYSESWVLEDSIVKSGSFNVDQGIGIRAIYGEKTGFAYADEISSQALLDASKAARAIAQSGNNKTIALGQSGSISPLYSQDNPLNSFNAEQKIDLLKQVDQKARSMDNRITQVMASLNAAYSVVLVTATDGTVAADIRPLIHMSVTVIAEQNGRRETGRSGGGNRVMYDYFLENNRFITYVEEAVEQALLQLEAGPAPAGTMPVVLGSGWAGIILHEAIGHGLEGDFNRKGSSAFSNRIGEKVASDQCTIVDDGTISNRRGSLTLDDEGTQSQNTVLIENGILKNYMQDKLNARLMNMTPTGNGRRQSYAHLPMPRMTNTYMLAGKYAPEEIIASVSKGLYAKSFSGGQVDITSGKFVFSASEAYLIENGKITAPVKGATLVGSGPEVLTKVSMVGNDFALDSGIGTCGKDGQAVPVGVGQPSLKVDELTVGGTQA